MAQKKEPRADLSGKIINYLTVIKYVGCGKWECMCSCGNTTIVRTGDLNRGGTHSCGCKLHEDRFEDLSGQKYNHLTILEFYSKRGYKNKPYYTCLCDCGNKTIVRGSHVKSGKVKSCGCLKYKKKGNEYVVDGDITTIKMANNKETIIDTYNIEKAKQHTWYLTKQGYVCSHSNHTLLLLSRYLTNCENGLVVDHINHIETDNRESNLRVCTNSQNTFYRSKNKRNTSGCVGVNYSKRSKKWDAELMCNRKIIKLGSYDNYEDAVLARLEGEEKYFEGFTSRDLIKNTTQQN